jgi:hypothetical protein
MDHGERFFSMKPHIAINAKKAVIFVHRWLGVWQCLLFLLWFVSGVAMMYWDYPEVSPGDHMAREVTLSPVQIRLMSEDAYARLRFNGSGADRNAQ